MPSLQPFFSSPHASQHGRAKLKSIDTTHQQRSQRQWVLSLPIAPRVSLAAQRSW